MGIFDDWTFGNRRPGGGWCGVIVLAGMASLIVTTAGVVEVLL